MAGATTNWEFWRLKSTLGFADHLRCFSSCLASRSPVSPSSSATLPSSTECAPVGKRLYFPKGSFYHFILKVGISTPVSYPKSLAVMRMHLREDLQLTKTMLTIFVVFLVTFLPAVVSNVLESRLPFPTLHLVASILSWTSAVINPLVYSLLHHQYKEVQS